jgi:hypothetical protein
MRDIISRRKLSGGRNFDDNVPKKAIAVISYAITLKEVVIMLPINAFKIYIEVSMPPDRIVVPVHEATLNLRR